MNTKFYDFLKSINAFDGSKIKEHNTLFTYSTLFTLQKSSVINYKMIKVQLKFLSILLHNLLLKKNKLVLTNFDRYHSDLLNLPEFVNYLQVNTAEKWFFSTSSNYAVTCLSDRYLYQQFFSALLSPLILVNIGNVEHYRLNHFSIKRRLLLFSTINTNGKIIDFQYYIILNSSSYLTLTFIMYFFFDILKKYTYFDILSSHNNLLRYRYWFGVYHIFNKRYARRSIILSGLLTKGLLLFCLQKLHKSYRKIVLFNFYCSHFDTVLAQNSVNTYISTASLRLGHDSRFLKRRKRRKFYRFTNKKFIKHQFFRLKLRSLQFYFIELMRRRLRVKRFVRLVITNYTKYATISKRADWLITHSNRFFFNLPITSYVSYRRAANYIFLQDKFRPFCRFRESTRFSYVQVFFRKITKWRKRNFFFKRRWSRRNIKQFFILNAWKWYRKRNKVYFDSWPELNAQELAYPYFFLYYKKNIRWLRKHWALRKSLSKKMILKHNYRRIWFKFVFKKLKSFSLARFLSIRKSKKTFKKSEKAISKAKKGSKI